MQLNAMQTRVFHSVLSIFETGKLPSPAAYGTCTVLADGAGFSAGLHQAVDRSNSLDAIILRYQELKGQYATDFTPFLSGLAANTSIKLDPKALPQWAKDFIVLFKKTGADPLMQQAQDEVFERDYLVPALKVANEIGAKYALTGLVCYDTSIHSGPGRIATHRAAFPEKSPKNGGDEKAWTRAYLAARRAWLLQSTNPLVQKTTYRIDALKGIADSNNWDLVTPLTVRNIQIT